MDQPQGFQSKHPSLPKKRVSSVKRRKTRRIENREREFDLLRNTAFRIVRRTDFGGQNDIEMGLERSPTPGKQQRVKTLKHKGRKEGRSNRNQLGESSNNEMFGILLTGWKFDSKALGDNLGFSFRFG
jgi:hypothetical protein